MQTPHEVIRAFKQQHHVDDKAFFEWCRDADIREEEFSDSRFLYRLEQYVEERDDIDA